MIELVDVSRVYMLGGQPLRALDGVSETVETGEYVAIMGPSGSGKSTMLHVLGCLDRPTSGLYRLDGEDVGSLAEEELSSIRRHRIGFVFQTFHLIGRLTAAENVAFPMIFAGIPRAERQERVRTALEAVGLAERENHRPAELSGGERQRVAIARATIMRPRLLLADEPTGNLDSAAGRSVMALIEAMNAEGLTLIVVTHDASIAGRASRVVVMRDGQIIRRIVGRDLVAGTAGSPVAEPAP